MISTQDPSPSSLGRCSQAILPHSVPYPSSSWAASYMNTSGCSHPAPAFGFCGSQPLHDKVGTKTLTSLVQLKSPNHEPGVRDVGAVQTQIPHSCCCVGKAESLPGQSVNNWASAASAAPARLDPAAWCQWQYICLPRREVTMGGTNKLPLASGIKMVSPLSRWICNFSQVTIFFLFGLFCVLFVFYSPK